MARKFALYNREKTYEMPFGKLATPEYMQNKAPAMFVSDYMIETDEEGDAILGYYKLSTMRTKHNVDPQLTSAEAVQYIEDLFNSK